MNRSLMSSSEVTVNFPLVGFQSGWVGAGIVLLVVGILGMRCIKARKKK